METEKKEPTLQERVEQMAFIQSVFTFMPDIAKMWPQANMGIDAVSTAIDNYLGDNDKMIVITRKNGITGAIVFNPKVQFNMTNEMDVTSNGTVNPIVNTYSKDEYKKKLMESTFMQTLKDRYEKLDPAEASNTSGGIMGMLSNIMPQQEPEAPPLSIEP